MIKNTVITANKNFYAKYLSKILCLFIVVFICFNSMFSSFVLKYDRDDLAAISSIQKDVFSAIFFISGTIEKINESLSVSIGLKTTSRDNEKKKDSTPVSRSSKDVILIENKQIQNIKILKFLQEDGSSFLTYVNLYVPLIYYSGNNSLYRKSGFYFIVMLLFFASAKKIYVYLNKINREYINPLAV